jgi:hypothetical protein
LHSPSSLRKRRQKQSGSISALGSDPGLDCKVASDVTAKPLTGVDVDLKGHDAYEWIFRAQSCFTQERNKKNPKDARVVIGAKTGEGEVELQAVPLSDTEELKEACKALGSAVVAHGVTAGAMTSGAVWSQASTHQMFHALHTPKPRLVRILLSFLPLQQSLPAM